MKCHLKNRTAPWLMSAGLLATSLPSVSADQQVLLEQARDCTSETRRLERLACFDRVFHTPLADAKRQVKETLRPESWRQAYRQEDERRPGQGPIYRNTGALAGHMITIPALGTRPPRPLLALQCHNNITELSVLLPEAVRSERLRLSFDGDYSGDPGLWRVRDDGFVVSAGRGLPSIRMARGLAALQDTELSADNRQLDGLMFDLAGLDQAMKPLRKSCGW
ncbi:type VI secretion system-associated protein VasI [Marinobacter sp.]|uniref:type VI secretion system-associated protein VasI n=1 Tax=Marinobacter sp. TaxID=50741 RepID=UPI0019BE65D9|nr:type VI secretion system-associated protein VasI [Marinobacter sp.]MBC7191164.1 type VI secretion system-associated protein TagO [Marinobacter sp.]